MAHAALATSPRCRDRADGAIFSRRPRQPVRTRPSYADASDVTASQPILVARALTRRFGGLVANDNVSLDLAHGELHALLGPNGAGKSTFINLLSGELEASS